MKKNVRESRYPLFSLLGHALRTLWNPEPQFLYTCVNKRFEYLKKLRLYLNLNTKLHLEISLTFSRTEKYLFGIKYFEKFYFMICNIFYMTIWIYKCKQKVSIIEKITKVYLILHTKLHIEISLLWSKINKYIIIKYSKKFFLNI